MMWPLEEQKNCVGFCVGFTLRLSFSRMIFWNRNSLKLALDGWPCEHRSPEAISICSVPTFLASQLFWVIRKWLILQTKTSPPPKKDMFFPYQKRCVFSQPQTCIGKPPRLGSSWSCTARRAMATYKTHSIGGNLREAPTNMEKVNKSDQTKHVSRNISFEIWVNISKTHRSKWEAINIIHHLYSRDFFMCQFKSSCQCPESTALQRDLCWQSEDVLFLSLCKLRFPEGITKPPLALKLQFAKFCNMSTTVQCSVWWFPPS